MRGSKLSSERRLERPFLRWGPDCEGSEDEGRDIRESRNPETPNTSSLWRI